MWYFLIHLISVLVLANCGEKGEAQESLIIKKIMSHYNPDIRPEESHNEALHVHFEIKIQKIVKLDVKQQLFIVNSFIRMTWTDSQLVWNATEYGGVNKVNVDRLKIWTPDVMLYNTATEISHSHTDLYKTKVLLLNNGSVIWVSPVTWKVSCGFDVTWFPIDKQICTLTFGSWTYMSSQLELSFYGKEGGNTEHAEFAVHNGEWDILDVELTRRHIKYDCCPEPFSTIEYKFVMNRMALYYFLYIILPLMSQVFLFLMVFHIPYDSGERMGFGVTILLSITVYLLVISEKLPEKSDDRPLLGICFIVEFYILCIALLCAGVVTKCSLKKSKPPEFLIRMFGVTTQCCKKVKSIYHSDPEEQMSMIELNECNDQTKHGELKHRYSSNNSSGHTKDKSNHRSYTDTASLGSTTGEYTDEESNNKIWKNICDHLDRIFFYFFLFLIFLAPFIISASLNQDMKGI